MLYTAVHLDLGLEPIQDILPVDKLDNLDLFAEHLDEHRLQVNNPSLLVRQPLLLNVLVGHRVLLKTLLLEEADDLRVLQVVLVSNLLQLDLRLLQHVWQKLFDLFFHQVLAIVG